MKVQLKHIFSFLLLLVSVAVIAQEPDEPVRSDRDSLKVSIDSLNIESDTIRIDVLADTVNLTSDSLQFKQDTTIISPDNNYPPDTIKTPIDTVNIHSPDSTTILPLDSVQVDSIQKKIPKINIKETQESVKQPKDTIIGPSGFEVFIDYGKLLSIPSDFETKAEVGISYTYREKLMVLLEVGLGKISPQEAIKNGSYTSEGYYARGGMAYGGEILPKSYLYIGLMYGASRFEDSGSVQIESQVSDDLNQSFGRADLEASWIEFVIISETEIRDNIFLGSKWRLRNLINFNYEYDPIVYAIPGYGRSFDNSIPAVNLYIKYRF